MGDSPAVVSYTREGNLAMVCVDHPPVNALSSPVIDGLGEAIEQYESDSGADMAVLFCQGRGFIAGADIKEPPSAERSDRAAATVQRIAECPKPWIAAIHGAALGGGLETAMACDFRCATSDARLGLPEVKIGAVPGYGGTQRLPRLVGLQKALDMALSGEAIAAEEAQQRGLIDRLLEGDLLQAARSWALELLQGGQPSRKTDRLPILDVDQADNWCEQALRQLPASRAGEDAPALIAECFRRAARGEIREGLAFERQVSRSRLNAPQSLAMRHLFFAGIALRKSPGQEEAAWAACREMMRLLETHLGGTAAGGIHSETVRQAFRQFGWAGGPFASNGAEAEVSTAMLPPDTLVQDSLAVLQKVGAQALERDDRLRAGDLDVVFCERLGFPRYHGGPLYHATIYKQDPGPVSRAESPNSNSEVKQ